MANEMEQRSPEWFEARKGKITASMVGAILGLAPYMTRADAMRSLVRSIHGAEPEFTGNIATEYGQNNEAGAVVEYTMETANKVEAVGFIINPQEDWAGCSPDGLIGTDGGLEVKCPFGKRKDQKPEFKPLADQPHYYAQVQFSLWVTGRKFWHFYQWSGAGTKLECVLPDQAWRDENLPKLRQFYAEVLAEDPAPHLEPRRVEVDTLEAARMVAEWDQLTEAIDRATERKADLLAQMVKAAGEKNALFAGRKLTLTHRTGSVSYAKALAVLAPGADLSKWRGKPSSSWVIK